MDGLTDIAAEHLVIGLAIYDNARIAKAAHISSEDFADQYHQAIWEAVKVVHGKGMVVSPITVGGYLGSEDVEEYVRKLVEHADLYAPLVSLFDEKVGVVRDLATRRRIIAESEAMSARARQFDMTADEVIATGIGSMQRLASEGPRKGVSKREAAKQAAACLTEETPCYQTGLWMLDESMGGGLYAGKMYGIAARKKVGKTIIAGSISHSLNMSGVRHLFICGEMSAKELEQRNMARELRFNSVAFLKRDMPGLPPRADMYAETIPDHTVYENAAGATLDDVRRMVAVHLAKNGIKGFILDYWQLVGGKAAKETEEYHLRTVAQWCADMCRKENLWCIITAQVNQDGNTRGGEGLKLACDQYYTLHREKDSDNAWMEMEESRYTMYADVGSKDVPGLVLDKHGPHFRCMNF